MSSGKEFQRTDAATGNERRPTVDRRNGGTCSSCDDDERSRRRPADRRRGSADSSKVEQDRAAREKPWCHYILPTTLLTSDQLSLFTDGLRCKFLVQC